VKKLEAFIQEQVAAEKLPQCIAALQQGKQLEFGGTTITKNYIKTEHDSIRWGELGNIQAWQGTLRLWKKGKQAISIMISMPSTPNFVLLVSLIQYLNENWQTSALLSHDMADEKNVLEEPNTPVKPQTGIRMKPGGNTDARLSGLFILLLGTALGYWQILLPIKKALQREASISYFAASAILVPIAIFMGLFLLIFGAEGLGFLSKPSSKIGLVVFYRHNCFCSGMLFRHAFHYEGIGISLKMSRLTSIFPFAYSDLRKTKRPTMRAPGWWDCCFTACAFSGTLRGLRLVAAKWRYLVSPISG
jgi:hypothetical protein